MFVLLEHDPGSGGPVHWDLLIEVADMDRLPTWRLSQNPITANNSVPAERIVDHRRHYLAYEGDISGGRGTVKRLDRGDAIVHLFDPDGETLAVDLHGDHLQGRYEIQAIGGDGLALFKVHD